MGSGNLKTDRFHFSKTQEIVIHGPAYLFQVDFYLFLEFDIVARARESRGRLTTSIFRTRMTLLVLRKVIRICHHSSSLSLYIWGGASANYAVALQ